MARDAVRGRASQPSLKLGGFGLGFPVECPDSQSASFFHDFHVFKTQFWNEAPRAQF